MLNSIFLACCSGCSLSCFYFPLFSLNVSGISDYLIWGVGVHNTTCSSYRKGEEEWEKKEEEKKMSLDSSAIVFYPTGICLSERKSEREQETKKWANEWEKIFLFFSLSTCCRHLVMIVLQLLLCLFIMLNGLQPSCKC
jgi:hypothetical protein